MDFQATYLTRKEMRRFLEIANGDTTAKNTPEEDALFRMNLIKEYLRTSTDLSTGETSADYRAVKLSDLGKAYYGQHMNERRESHKENRRHWLQTIFTIVEIAIAIAAIVIPYILSMPE